MKNLYIYFITFALLISCEKNSNNEVLVCGCENPTTELNWLKQLIEKAESDVTGNYLVFVHKVRLLCCSSKFKSSNTLVYCGLNFSHALNSNFLSQTLEFIDRLYLGTIYLEEDNNNDIFFVDMALGSGGIYGYRYNCSGDLLQLESKIPKRERIIYQNLYKNKK